MTATPFDLATCPAVSRAEAASSRALGRFIAGLPPSWIVELPLLGQVTVWPTAVVPRVPADALAVVVRRDGQEGRLWVPTPLASRWIDVALCGAEGFGPARPLGRAERGVLIALVSPLLDAAGWSIGLGAPPEREGPAVALRLTGGIGAGTIWLQVPPSIGRSSAVSVERSAGLRLAASARVASTTLAAGQVAQLVPGDAVVFDGSSALGAEASWELGLGLGGFCAAVRLAPDGRATITNGWRHARRMSDATDVTTEVEKTAEPSAVLAGAPIEVVAELGRVTLRADEVLGLAPGVVLGMRIERTSAVVLRVGGEIWAEGELVNVDGEVGVRVTRLTRG